MLSNNHLGLAFIFSLLFTPALYSSYPAQAIIAPLSVHKLAGGINAFFLQLIIALKNLFLKYCYISNLFNVFKYGFKFNPHSKSLKYPSNLFNRIELNTLGLSA